MGVNGENHTAAGQAMSNDYRFIGEYPVPVKNPARCSREDSFSRTALQVNPCMAVILDIRGSIITIFPL
jgi:hypothetical protein